MKQRIFTLIALAALVLIGGNAFAAPDTNVEPIVGTTYTYTWAAVTTKLVPGDNQGSVGYAVTPSSSDDPTTAPYADGTVFNEEAGMVWANDGDNAVLQLSWTTAALANADYRLWLTVTSDGAIGGCSNYRFVTITPAIDFELISYGLQSPTIDPSTLGAVDVMATGSAMCQDLSTRELAGLEEDGSVTDGSVYWVFEAKQVFDFGVAWDASFTTTAVGGTREYWDGDSWEAYSTTIEDIATGTSQYFRVKIDAVVITNPAKGVDGTLAAVDASVSPRSDAVSTNNTKTGTVNPVPSIGAFN